MHASCCSAEIHLGHHSCHTALRVNRSMNTQLQASYMLHGRLMRHHLAHQAQQASHELVGHTLLGQHPPYQHAYPLSAFFPALLGVTPDAFSTGVDQALAMKPIIRKQTGNSRIRRNSSRVRGSGAAVPAARLCMSPVPGHCTGMSPAVRPARLVHVPRRLHMQSCLQSIQSGCSSVPLRLAGV